MLEQSGRIKLTTTIRNFELRISHGLHELFMLIRAILYNKRFSSGAEKIPLCSLCLPLVLRKPVLYMFHGILCAYIKTRIKLL